MKEYGIIECQACYFKYEGWDDAPCPECRSNDPLIVASADPPEEKSNEEGDSGEWDYEGKCDTCGNGPTIKGVDLCGPCATGESDCTPFS